MGCVAAFTGILFAVNLLKFASLIVAKGVGSEHILMVFLSLIPTFMEIAIPMAMLLGVMLAFARLSGDSELIVLRASGISLTSLIFPVVISGIAVTIISCFVSFIGRPWGYETLNTSLLEIASTTSTAGLDAGVFSKLGELTIYCETIEHSTGDMSHVLLDDRRDPLNRKIIFSKSGTLLNDQVKHQIIFYLKDGEIHEEHDGKYAVTHFKENVSVMNADELISSDGAGRKGKAFNAMSLEELHETKKIYADILRQLQEFNATNPKPGEVLDIKKISLPYGQQMSADQLNPKELKKRMNRSDIEAGRRLSMPFAAFVLALVGMSLGIQPPRTQRTFGIGLSAVFGLLVFVIYYGFLSVGIALAERGTVPTTISLWIPNAVVFVIALYSLRKLGKEKWQSVTEMVEVKLIVIINNLRRSFPRLRELLGTIGSPHS